MRACRICGNDRENRRHSAPEMMFGTRERFDYVECASCGCLQIAEIPADLARHYQGYYSLQDQAAAVGSPLKRWLRRRRGAHVFGGGSRVGALVTRLAGPPEHARWLARAGVGPGERILDVGCGEGWLLRVLHVEGFRHLTGLDPHLAVTRELAPGLRLVRGELGELEGTFDLVMLNHSFEHMPDPHAALERLATLLAPGATLLLRVPLAGSWAWRHYGVDWVQLDAPRHLYLHTERSLRRLAADHGYDVAAVEYDSTPFQFWGSDRYRAGVPLTDGPGTPAHPPPPRAVLRPLARRAAELNAAADGDQACFYLKRAMRP